MNKMSKIVVLASFYPKNEKNNEVKETILAMIDPTRSEEGNEIYSFYEVKNDDGKNISFHLLKSIKILRLWTFIGTLPITKIIDQR